MKNEIGQHETESVKRDVQNHAAGRLIESRSNFIVSIQTIFNDLIIFREQNKTPTNFPLGTT